MIIKMEIHTLPQVNVPGTAPLQHLIFSAIGPEKSVQKAYDTIMELFPNKEMVEYYGAKDGKKVCSKSGQTDCKDCPLRDDCEGA